MRRVDGKRRQHRKNVVEEVVLQPCALALGDLVGVDEENPDVDELLAQFPPAALLVGREHGDGVGDADKLFGRRQAILRHGVQAVTHLPGQAGDAHHEELVQVIGGNREEAELLQQRMAPVRRLFEHTAVEVKPGQLAIEKSLGRRAQCRRVGDGCGGFNGRDRGDRLNLFQRRFVF